MTLSRRTLLVAGQVGLALLLTAFLGRAVSAHWNEFRGLETSLRVRPGWIVLAVVIVFVTYGLLVAAWTMVLAGWQERLRYPAAVRIWTLSNLGRYLPGKVWSVAGLVVLARREGVAGWAAVGAAVAMQAIAVGSGVAVAAASAPGTLSAPALAAAAAVAAATIALLGSAPAMACVARMTGRELRPLPLGAVAVAGAATSVAWLGYGLSFWCLARGILGPTSLTLRPATGVFAAGYLVGLLAIFAPGGVGVREAVFVALLTPAVGSGNAIVLSVASRVLLTATEGIAALGGLGLGGRETGQTLDATRSGDTPPG
jgi:hypothetical protein